MNVERRDSPRIPFEQDVIVYARGRALPCRAADLSAGGIGLWATERVQLGEHVIVDMGLDSGTPLAVEGFIVREAHDLRAEQRYNWGVRFHGLAPRVQRLLASHVADQRHPTHRQRAMPTLRDRRPQRRPPPVATPSVSPGCGASARPAPLDHRARSTQNTPTPAPAPAFEQSAEFLSLGELATRAEPSPTFPVAPEPVPALPRNTPARPCAPWMGPRPSSIDPAQAERDRQRAELYRLARQAAEDLEDREDGD